jgi:hypothetical protein
MRPIPLLASLSLSFVAGSAFMQTATRREPQFENDQVRVWKTIIAPRQPLNYHRHDQGRVLIALTDGRLKVLDPSGKEVTTYQWERGKAYWLAADKPGETHADVNESTEPVEVIVVELKGK